MLPTKLHASRYKIDRIKKGGCTTPHPLEEEGGRGIRRRRLKKMKAYSSYYKNTHSPENFSINNIVSTLKDNHIDKWRSKHEDSEKSHFYKEIKTKYEPQGYLSSQSNIYFRNELTKLRISNHELMIENSKGRATLPNLSKPS